MKIFFIGSVEFSKNALEKLISLNENVVGVFTKEKSIFNADFVDLSEICLRNNVPFKYANNVNSEECIEWIKMLEPDIIFCFGWSQILKEEILKVASMGVVGFHPALLPQNRGRHPIIWALVLGLKNTGSTFFFMDDGVDSGDILSQKKIEINYDDNARTLYNKIINVALKQIEDFLPKLKSNAFIRIPQNHSKATYWRKRTENDGKIDFRMSSYAVYNLVRALTNPYVGAHLKYIDKDVKIWEVREEINLDLINIEPGKVLDIKDDNILVKCYDNAVWLIRHEFKDMPKIGDYL